MLSINLITATVFFVAIILGTTIAGFAVYMFRKQDIKKVKFNNNGKPKERQCAEYLDVFAK